MVRGSDRHQPFCQCDQWIERFDHPVPEVSDWFPPEVDYTDITRYINIKRGVVLITITAGWIMVPWKIVYSAASLLNFMTGLAVFLCPIAAIMATDYWLVKKRCVDVPSLYRRHGRYRYNYGVNWRAAVALLTSLVPNLPGYDHRFSPSCRFSLTSSPASRTP
jgi:cytosine/uracil/thiamine/allantoin permease